MSEQLAIPSKKGEVSEEEWQLRIDLAAAYRLIALYGWDDLIFTHLSVRIPGDEHHFLINPYGMMFEEITASSLVRIDQEGNKINPDDFDINPAGFTIHSAIHAVREDAACVMHTHTTAGVAVSAQKEGLLPLSQQSLFPLSGLAYHDYEGVALREDEKARLRGPDSGHVRRPAAGTYSRYHSQLHSGAGQKGHQGHGWQPCLARTSPEVGPHRSRLPKLTSGPVAIRTFSDNGPLPRPTRGSDSSPTPLSCIR